MMRGHQRGCRCVGCSPATRAKGMRALKRRARNPLTRSEALVVAKRAQHSLREARGLDGYPSSLVYAGRAAAYRDVVGDFTERRNPRRRPPNLRQYEARSYAYQAGYSSLLRAADRAGTVAVTPSISDRDAWGHEWTVFKQGWKDAQKDWRGQNPRRPSGRYSSAARAFLGGEVPALVAEGYPPRRAVAAALDMARRAGLKVPARNPDGTLSAWLERSGAYAQPHKSGAVAVYEAHRLSQALQWNLYRLKDYAVSSVSGPVTWLVKRNPLTRVETARVLQSSRRHLRAARALVGKREPFRQGLASGYADAEYSIARRYGEARAPYQVRPLVRNPGRAPWPMARGYHVGDRVTFRDRFERERTGRVVFAEPTHLVLNMGGAHGTPQVVHYDRVVKVRARRNPLTRAETADVLRDARTFRHLYGQALETGRQDKASFLKGAAHEALRIAGRHGQAKRYHPAYLPSRFNPLMLVNPRGLPRVVATLPASQLEVRYRRHGAHAGDYRHTFKRGVKVYGLADGSVLIRGAKPAWSLQ